MPTTQSITTITDANGLIGLVRQCRADRTPLIDYGIAHAGLGYPPPAHHVRIEQRGGVIEHYDRDLTLRVSAGATIGEIQEALRPSNQFLALDADDDLTLGEAIMHNVYGPLRIAYGGLRDQLLGLRYVDGLARDIHVGGRTVKNVAGYDVTRFMVGSLGELGVVYEATLRTYAVPRQVSLVELAIEEPGNLDGLLSQWMLADAAPAGLRLHRRDHKWGLEVAYVGSSVSCATQMRSLETLMAGEAGSRIATVNDMRLNDYLRHGTVNRAWRRNAGALVKIIVPPAFTGSTCAALATHLPDLHFDAMLAHGCIFVGGALSAEQAIQLSKRIEHRLEDHGGACAWHQRPAGAESIEPFGQPQPDRLMLEKLKATMDPDMLLNPGRFLGRRQAAQGTAA